METYTLNEAQTAGLTFDHLLDAVARHFPGKTLVNKGDSRKAPGCQITTVVRLARKSPNDHRPGHDYSTHVALLNEEGGWSFYSGRYDLTCEASQEDFLNRHGEQGGVPTSPQMQG